LQQVKGKLAMNMPRSIEEINEVEVKAGIVINGVDNANLMSVDSTESIETKLEEEKLSEEEINASNEELKEKEVVDTKLGTKEKDEKKKSGDDSTVTPKPEFEDSKNVQKRIGKLTKKMRTAERERDFEKDENTELKKKLEGMSAEIDKMSSKIFEADKPQKEDFEEEDEFIEALTDWKIDSKLKVSQKETEKIDKEVPKEDLKETYQGLDDAVESGREKYKNFDEIVFNEDLVISPEVTQIALDTDTPEDIIYFLASDPKESERISKLDPVRAAKEIGKIEVKLEVEKETPKSRKKLSNAPNPIHSVTTDGVTEKDPNKMSPKEYRAWRKG
jgi:hypothetical protein